MVMVEVETVNPQQYQEQQLDMLVVVEAVVNHLNLQLLACKVVLVAAVMVGIIQMEMVQWELLIQEVVELVQITHQVKISLVALVVLVLSYLDINYKEIKMSYYARINILTINS